MLKSANRNQRYCKNKRGTVFLEHSVHIKNVVQYATVDVVYNVISLTVPISMH